MKASIALVVVAFGTLAFGWVTGRDLVLYVSIVCSALAGIALLKSTLTERKRRGAQGQAPPPPAPGRGRDKRGSGRRGFLRRKSSKVQERDMYEPLPTVRTVRDPAEIARAQMADQFGANSVEGSGGSVIDFRTRLAAALDTSESDALEAGHQQSVDLWADLEPHDVDPLGLEDPERPHLVEPDAEDMSDLAGRAPESLDRQTGPIDIFSYEEGQASLLEDDADLEAAAGEAGLELGDEKAAVEATLPARGDEDEDEDDEEVVTDWIRIDDLPGITQANRGRPATVRPAGGRISSGRSTRGSSSKPAPPRSRSQGAAKAAAPRKGGTSKSPSITKVSAPAKITTTKKKTRAAASGRPPAAKAPARQRGPRSASRGPARAAGGDVSTPGSPEPAAPQTDDNPTD